MPVWKATEIDMYLIRLHIIQPNIIRRHIRLPPTILPVNRLTLSHRYQKIRLLYPKQNPSPAPNLSRQWKTTYLRQPHFKGKISKRNSFPNHRADLKTVTIPFFLLKNNTGQSHNCPVKGFTTWTFPKKFNNRLSLLFRHFPLPALFQSFSLV